MRLLASCAAYFPFPSLSILFFAKQLVQIIKRCGFVVYQQTAPFPDSRGEQLRAGLASNGSLHDAAGAASAAMSDDIHPLAPGDEPTGDVTEDEVTRAVTRAML